MLQRGFRCKTCVINLLSGRKFPPIVGGFLIGRAVEPLDILAVGIGIGFVGHDRRTVGKDTRVYRKTLVFDRWPLATVMHDIFNIDVERVRKRVDDDVRRSGDR